MRAAWAITGRRRLLAAPIVARTLLSTLAGSHKLHGTCPGLPLPARGGVELLEHPLAVVIEDGVDGGHEADGHDVGNRCVLLVSTEKSERQWMMLEGLSKGSRTDGSLD